MPITSINERITEKILPKLETVMLMLMFGMKILKIPLLRIPLNVAVICIGLICISGYGHAHAETALPRKVLILYDSMIGQTEKVNLIYQNGQAILNYYGLLTEFKDVNDQPLPIDAEMEDFRGIVTIFRENLKKDAENYLSWLKRQIQKGRKLVIIGKLGITTSPDQSPELNKLIQNIYKQLGFEYHDDFTVSQPLLRYVFKDKDRVEFERKYPLFPKVYEKFVPVDTSIRVYLTIQRTDKPKSDSALIFTGPAGGYAHEEYVYWQDPVTYRRQWYLNPFLFFKEALDISNLPTPDPTTLNGLRVAFSHIDGDGFAGPSQIDQEQLCAEIIRDHILKKYDYPVTVSVIVGEIDPKAAGNAELVKLAKEIYRLPNVEPASHSYSHPFYWDPDFKNEENKYEHQYGIYIPGYKHDPKMEIDYSMKYITKNLSPPDKPSRVFLWTGNCVPTETDIARCDIHGYYNMNGGDTIYDDVFNSYTSVAPLYRKVGGRFQVYTGQANENILTNLWKGPFFGFRNIITTMKRTGSPRRIAPIDVYYHFYSGEYKSSLKALQEVYDWVLKQAVTKVFTSDYLQMMEGYLKVQLFKDDSQRYIIKDYGKCLTIRINQEDKIPDLSRSVNVLGYVLDPQGLYVSLIPGRDKAIIALADISKRKRVEGLPYLRRATGWINTMQLFRNRVKLKYRGFGSGKIELGGMPPEANIDLTGSAIGNKSIQLTSNEKGYITITDVVSGNIEISWQ